MAGRNSIQILRGGPNYDPATSNEVLLDGQPFYSKKTKKLYIGDGTTQLKDLSGTSMGLDEAKLVSTVGNQTISGVKTFPNGLKVSHYYSGTNYVYKIVGSAKGLEVNSSFIADSIALTKTINGSTNSGTTKYHKDGISIPIGSGATNGALKFPSITGDNIIATQEWVSENISDVSVDFATDEELSSYLGI